MTDQDFNSDRYVQRSIFFRQRKSLLLVSLLLFFIYYSHLSINEVIVQGLRITVAIPESVHFMLWVTWLYFFIRYMQYFKMTAGESLPEVYRRERENLRNTSTPPMKALWKALFGNIYVTDYLLPMAFAIFAALFALVTG